ncbi:hypothetical protein FSP39_019525 [Pinctada imbricata]|uniref:Uncharacterized protein n=1 Tax=Pinctada imbricata TaxID=66713 RepID=A0AA89C536_PINIB|nr:hypothetical protein FSP39_019525 [Pinctada imbricata]
MDFLINTEATPSDMERLYNNLFSSYNKAIRPFQTGTWTTEISFVYIVENINGMDEVAETMTTAGKLRILWNDTTLSWNASNYSGISLMYISQNSIWKPDLVLANGNGKITELGGSYFYVAISDNGQMHWDPYEVFTTLCAIDITYFPFDKQECFIKFSIWNHFYSEVIIKADSKVVMETAGNGIWQVDGTSSDIGVTRTQSTAHFRIKLRRKPYYFIFNIVLPIIFLGFVSTFVFLVPVVSGEKTGYSITIFLSFAVFLSILSAEIPKNSDKRCLLSIYVMCEVVLSILILIITNIQLRLYHRSSEHVGDLYRIIIRSYRKCFKTKIVPNQSETRDDTTDTDMYSLKGVKTDLESVNINAKFEIIENHQVIDSTSEEVCWTDVSNAIDGIMFPILTSLNVVFTTAMFAIICSN